MQPRHFPPMRALRKMAPVARSHSFHLICKRDESSRSTDRLQATPPPCPRRSDRREHGYLVHCSSFRTDERAHRPISANASAFMTPTFRMAVTLPQDSADGGAFFLRRQTASSNETGRCGRDDESHESHRGKPTPLLPPCDAFHDADAHIRSRCDREEGNGTVAC